MARIRASLGEAWRFRWPALATVYLLSPVLIYDLWMVAQDGRGVDKLTFFTVPASVLSVVAAQTFLRRLWVAQLALFPFYILTGVDLYLITHYGMRLSSSGISIVLENTHHIGDFLRTQWLPIGVASTALVGFFIVIVVKTKALVLRSRRPLWLACGGLLAVYGVVTADRARAFGGLPDGVLEVVSHDRSSPFGVLPQGYLAYRIYREALEHQRQAGSFSFDATRTQTPEESEIYVLVVGESARPDNWGVYGYHLPTTPRLAALQNLVVFSDVLAQVSVTRVSVPSMITRMVVEKPQERQAEKSLISAMKEAGFTTFWLSTQQRDKFTGAINRYSAEADELRYFERRHDLVLVEAVRSTLASLGEGPHKLFFVLHTQGSHFVFKDKYPARSAKFPTDLPGMTQRERVVAHYDNTVAYTDEVLGELFDLLEQQPALSAAMYVSDHGENLYDDDRQLFGHFYNNEFDLPIPVVLWCSQGFCDRFGEKIAAARVNATRKLSTRNIFSTLADIASLSIPDMDLSHMSVLSPTLVDSKRWVLMKDQPVDYDAWRESALGEKSARLGDKPLPP